MKYSKYYGSEYAPDPFFCIEVLEKQIATLTAERDRLKEALKEIINLGHGEGKHIEGEIAQVALVGEE